MIVTTYCTAQSLILQLISSDELLVLLCVIEVTTGGEGGPIFQSSVVIVRVEYQESMIMNNIKLFLLLQIYLIS